KAAPPVSPPLLPQGRAGRVQPGGRLGSPPGLHVLTAPGRAGGRRETPSPPHAPPTQLLPRWRRLHMG
ncbi:hypothetical protein P7K49_038507, partial [Saguinus oedipus]